MKRPLQALLIAPDREKRRRILDGTITASIRADYRAFYLGPIMLCCHIEPWCVMAKIQESPNYCVANHLSLEQLQEAGYASLTELLADLRKFYPEINPQSPVTFLRWTELQGKLVK